MSVIREISIKGRKQQVPAFSLDGVTIVTNGRFLTIAKIFDEYWLPLESLPNPSRVIDHLKTVGPKPDLFTFAQRAPDGQPKFSYYMEWDNVAAIPVSSYDHWFHKQISSAARRNIRTSEKKDVLVRVEPYDERYVHGIMSIFNESRIRAGRKYWHYGKTFETVQTENGTYRDRSTFLAAYVKDQMIGYMKIVWDVESAAIMQILSKMAFRDKRPNNALLSQAVKLCEQRGVKYLLYERFVYGNKGEDSLTRFKQANGFVRMNLPRYYVPLTSKGRVALSLGLHRDVKDLVPQWMRRMYLDMRDKWYAGQMEKEG